MKLTSSKGNITLLSLLLITLVIISVFFYRESYHSKNISEVVEKNTLLEESLTEKVQDITLLEEEKNRLEEELGKTLEELDENEDVLNDLDKRNREILELITIDKELLQKYSKVSFLNEHYSPTNISAIDSEFWTNESKLIDVNSRIKKHLEDLLEDAKDDDIELRVLSGYRSFDQQASLKGQYLVTYGSGANTFSADQGYSEHQLGTTVDFTTPTLGTSLTTNFENTEAFNWLDKNAWKYGFVMSYPKGNEYYKYEPWHWRFVSKDLARKLRNDDKNFYDLDQRDMWEYLEGFFD